MNEDANLESPAVVASTRTSGMAIASLVLGVIGITLVPMFGSIAAVVFGHIARNRIRRDPSLTGGGLALAGLILGWIVVGLAVLTFLIAGLLLAVDASG